MSKRFIFPAGEYYVGDPCYAIDNAVWDDLIAVTGCFGYNPDDLSDWNDGLYHYKYRPCWCHGTAYGDGMYRGSDDYHYAVDANNRIDVNSFDWSHVNNLTTNFGRITPVFCELVPAKGSLRINPQFGLELMPMVFPVQTRVFARLNFFKVTLRSMWEDYSDFISNFRDDLEEPYINCSALSFSKMFTTGSLGDYLGMPTRKSYYASSTNVAATVQNCS